MRCNITPRMCSFVLLAGAIILVGTVPNATAGPLTFTASTTDSDGAAAAQAVFTPVIINGQGYIQIVVTNTQSGNSAPGTAISQLFFSVANGLTAPTGLSNVSGNTINFNTNQTGSVNTNNPSSVHWGFATNNTIYGLIDVTGGSYGGSLTGPGGQPDYLIIGPNPDTSNGHSLTGSQHNPYFDQSATFLVSDPGVTTTTILDTSNIVNVYFGWGTQPEAQKIGSGSGSSGPPVTPPVTTPEPASVVLLGIGGLAFGAARLRRRKVIA